MGKPLGPQRSEGVADGMMLHWRLTKVYASSTPGFFQTPSLPSPGLSVMFGGGWRLEVLYIEMKQ